MSHKKSIFSSPREKERYGHKLGEIGVVFPLINATTQQKMQAMYLLERQAKFRIESRKGSPTKKSLASVGSCRFTCGCKIANCLTAHFAKASSSLPLLIIAINTTTNSTPTITTTNQTPEPNYNHHHHFLHHSKSFSLNMMFSKTK